MSAEQKLAQLVAATGYSMTTVRKWWKRKPVRKRTADALQAAASELKIRRPKETT